MPRKTDWKFGVIRSALAALLLVGFTGEARAGLLDCPPEFTADGTAKVHDGGGDPVETAASACQFLDPPDNNNVANGDECQQCRLLWRLNMGGSRSTDWQRTERHMGHQRRKLRPVRLHDHVQGR